MKYVGVAVAILLAGFTVQASVIVNYGADGGANMFAGSANHSPKMGSTYTAGNVYGDETTHLGISVALPESQTYNGAGFANGALSISKDLNATGAGLDNIFLQDAATMSFDGMVVWENFAGTDTTLETLSIGARHIGNASSFRYVLEKGNGSWHASEVILTGGLTFSSVIGSSAASLNWFDFTPLNGDAGSVGAAAAIDMTDVTSVGTYFNVTRTSNGNTGVKINYFNAIAVPEPATFGLLAIFGGALLAVRRRRT